MSADALRVSPALNLGFGILPTALSRRLTSSTGSDYAEWQYTKDSAFRDVNPGVSVRMAVAYDVPDNLGHAILSTKVLQWIYLGDFSQMPSED